MMISEQTANFRNDWPLILLTYAINCSIKSNDGKKIITHDSLLLFLPFSKWNAIHSGINSFSFVSIIQFGWIFYLISSAEDGF